MWIGQFCYIVCYCERYLENNIAQSVTEARKLLTMNTNKSSEPFEGKCVFIVHAHYCSKYILGHAEPY